MTSLKLSIMCPISVKVIEYISKYAFNIKETEMLPKVGACTIMQDMNAEDVMDAVRPVTSSTLIQVETWSMNKITIELAAGFLAYRYAFKKVAK